MLSDLGLPVLRFLDDEVLPVAAQLIETTHQYVRAWLALWDDDAAVLAPVADEDDEPWYEVGW